MTVITTAGKHVNKLLGTSKTGLQNLSPQLSAVDKIA